MKKPYVILGTVGMVLLAGCVSTPIALAPVGPGPMGRSDTGSKGQLLVYSAREGHGEGNNPAYYQPADYYLCNQQGKPIRRINNVMGHYVQVPRPVSLPAGNISCNPGPKVRQPLDQSAGGNPPGETTIVHLDNGWAIPADIPRTELVRLPNGYPVGWRAD